MGGKGQNGLPVTGWFPYLYTTSILTTSKGNMSITAIFC
jgi:hypothetical protein